LQWILNGAQPTDTVRILLSERGILLKKHLQIGVNKGAITQESAEAKFNTWKSDKDAKVLGKSDALTSKKDADKKSKLEAETKISQARAEAIAKKNIVEEPVAEVEETEAVAEAPQVEEAPSTETAAE
ncbi:MAG: 30S ribosomal protein S16, partial [Pseudarcicella sp.]|nr:30S ribosomal protein S16 [Pseudarcicella sp.]